MTNDNKRNIWIPAMLACAVCAGIMIGNFVTKNKVPTTENIRPGSKLDLLLNTIQTQYVDTVDAQKLVEDAIPTIVSELDPHSVYIPAKDLEATNEELEGSFSGIGVQFNIQNDTIMVVSVISGGPSEKVGIIAGDRIVAINDSAFVGKEVTNEKVMKRLRGPKKSVVNLGIKRNTAKDILAFSVTRDEIPVNSVDASYMLNQTAGYIRVSKFGRTTYNEFVSGLAKLRSLGAKEFVVDLRGNSGGYLDMAINMVNEFLSDYKLIVYTEGKTVPRSNAVSTGSGSFQEAPLVVLIDEWSASASEIFAGAIQDNDRGMIVGRRSFGKGLVQQQIPFSDGSALRLTIARYYTPSGRCIQKEYKLGKDEDYSRDIFKRYEHGEFYSKDSIKMNDSLCYTTANGRLVYGGGGIMPDVFVPNDTTGITPYFDALFNSGAIYQFAFQYTDKNRDTLNKFESDDALVDYLRTQNLGDQVVEFALTKGIKKRPVYIAMSKDIIDRYVISYIARNIKGDEIFYKTFQSKDKTIQTALELIKKKETFPTAPENKE